MSSYLISELLLLVFIALWAWTKHDLSEEKEDANRLKNQNNDYQSRLKECHEEIGELKSKRKKDLFAFVRYLVQKNCTDCDPEELTQTIIENLHHIGEVSSVEDFLKYDFEYIVKVALLAEDGLLDVHYNYAQYGDRPFLLTAEGRRIFLSRTEAKRIQSRDYSEILKTFLKPSVASKESL